MANSGDVQDPPAHGRDRVGRFIAKIDRHSGRYGLILWISAIACLALYAHGGFPGPPIEFAMLECWLIGLGCVGVPILAMRMLGNRLTPASCLVIAALLTGVAALFTALVATDQLHVSVLVASFSLIIPEALAIHAVNAADCLHRTATAERDALAKARIERDQAVESAFLSGIAASYTHSRSRAEDFNRLLTESTEEIQAVTDALLDELEKRHARAHTVEATGGRILHLITDRQFPPQGRASGD